MDVDEADEKIRSIKDDKEQEFQRKKNANLINDAISHNFSLLSSLFSSFRSFLFCFILKFKRKYK